MNCQGCHNQFNEAERSPRLLISCGHSICEKCTAEIYRDGSIVCPECHFRNFAPMVTYFPRNLALINIHKAAALNINLNTLPSSNIPTSQSSNYLDLNSNSAYKPSFDTEATPVKMLNIPRTNDNLATIAVSRQTETDLKTTHRSTISTDPRSQRSSICEKHTKQFEAYCENDERLLCITCILEDGHRQHQIDSIQTAVTKQKQRQSDIFDQSRTQEKQAIVLIADIESNLISLQDQAQTQLGEICAFFSEERKLINERESALKKRVAESLHEQQLQMEQLQCFYESHVSDINAFQQTFRSLGVLPDMEYLRSIPQLSSIVAKLTTAQHAAEKVSFTDLPIVFTKDAEIQALSKQILAQLSTQQSTAFQKKHPSTFHHPVSSPQIAFHTNSSNATTPTSVNSANSQIKKTFTTAASTNTQAYHPASQLSAKATQSSNSKKTTSKKEQIYSMTKNKTSQALPTTKKEAVLAGGCAPAMQQAQTVSNLSAPVQKGQKMERSNSTINTEIAKPLNNYHELRNMLKEKLLPATHPSAEQHNNNNNNRGSSTPSHCISGNPAGPTQRNLRNEVSYNQEQLNKNTVQPERHVVRVSPLQSNNISNMSRQSNIREGEKVPTLPSTEKQFMTTFDSQKQPYAPQQQQQLSNQAPYGRFPRSSPPRAPTTTSAMQMGMHQVRSQPSEVSDDDSNFQFLDHLSVPSQHATDPYYYVSSQSASKNYSYMNESPNSSKTQQQRKSRPTNKNEQIEIYSNKCEFSTIAKNQKSHSIYVFGGFIESSQYVIERLDLQKRAWENVSNLPTNRAKFSAVSLSNGSILLLGGKQDGNRVAICEEFNPKSNSVSISNIMLSVPKSGFGAVNIGNDRIIVVGGNDGNTVQSAVEMYDWRKFSGPTFLSSMNERRDELAVTLGLDGKIYAIGGFGGAKNTCLRSAERYDPITNKWQPIASMNTPRRALSAVTLPDGIYAIGGFDGVNYLSSVEKYDESINQWVFISSMNLSRCTLSTIVSEDNSFIYAIGGFDNGPLNSIERYNVMEDKWEVHSEMNHKRFMHCSVLLSC